MPVMEVPHDVIVEATTDVFAPLCFCVEAMIVIINVFPIATVYAWKSSHDRLAIDELIVALSVTDMLSVLVPSPLALMSYFTNQWYGGARTCDVFQLTTTWFQVASMALVTFMCIDRILVLRLVTGSNKPCSGSTGQTRVRACVLAAYICSLVLVVLPFVGLAPRALSVSGMSCKPWLFATPRARKEHTFYICFLLFGYTNLLVALAVCGAVLVALWRFWHQLEQTNSSPTGENESMLQVDRRSVVEFTAMTSTVTLTFYAAWLPTLVLTTLQKSGRSVPGQAMQYGLLSTTLTGLLNPVIYAAFSPSYRRGYASSVRAVSRFLFGCPLTRAQIIRATTLGGSAASFAALLSSRLSDVSDSVSVGHMSNSHSQSSDMALLGAGARIPAVTDAYGPVQTSEVDTTSMVRDDVTARAYRLTAAALYKDFYGSELSMLSEEGEKANKVPIEGEDCIGESDENEDRMTHTVTIEESVI